MDLWGMKTKTNTERGNGRKYSVRLIISRITECWKTPSTGAGSALFAMRAARPVLSTGPVDAL